MGTKDYRKPEWVTHMEELKTALQGNKNENLACVLHVTSNISLDSLELPDTHIKIKGRNLASQSCELLSDITPNMEYHESFYIHTPQPMSDTASMRSSKESVQSEPVPQTYSRRSFIESSMNDYLNSHRHSLSSLMEIILSKDRHSYGNECEKKYSNSEDNDIDSNLYVYDDSDDKSKCKYIALSPIEENSETSTRSSSYREYGNLEKNKNGSEVYTNKCTWSSSCDALPSEPFYVSPVTQKYQTFPRSKNVGSLCNSSDYLSFNNTYPLEPREIDPFAYYQLHTADSQEELQEFLLLESECMNDTNGRGLASAFDVSTDELIGTDKNQTDT